MITTVLNGGMGNQMFEYACARSLALRRNTTLSLDVTELLDRGPRPKRYTFRTFDLDVFSIQAAVIRRTKSSLWIVFERFFRRLHRPRGVERSPGYDPRIRDLPANARLVGYWQSPKYFEEYADVIRADFTLAAPLDTRAAALREEIATRASVCVHVRRGDYVGNPAHGLVSREYYERALTTLAARTPLGHVYVFSDDIEWCRQNLAFPIPTTYVDSSYAGTKGEGHLELMRACTHFIIANSTFSWWAAWLANKPEKIVIAPKRWFGGARSTEDLFPPEWLTV